MLNYIWGIMIVISIVYSFFAGTSQNVTASLFNSAESAVNLVISMAGMICFWTGIMEIAEKSGITNIIAKIFSPVLRRLFRDISPNSKAFHYICMNISANLLGLGNAATPFGLSAMQEMKKQNKANNKLTATPSMILFIVMNTSSIQIIPTTLLTLRMNYSSNAPYEVMPCIWITSIISLLVGIILVTLWNYKDKDNKILNTR